MPAGIHLVSPFCDLAWPAEDLGPAADSDPWLSRIALIQLAACYIHGADPGQALVSPARADLSGLPPLLIQAAEPEALFASARRLADRARGPASRSRSARSPTASIRSSCSISCPKPTARWRNSPRSRRRRAD